ncbi:MAG: 50S ribosomal protein L3 [Candidatus Omnitrophica bacterium]|nr:50S ribosomal protein L3 [Candidatus Omnitrophota bacterium]
MNGILGKKLGMTQIFSEDGAAIPVTVIESGPCTVLQVKTIKTDGYNAIQLGFEDVKESKLKKPVRGKFKKINVTAKKFIKEVSAEDPQNYKVGQNIDLTIFSPGDYVRITGTSKGRGFQGGIKRWNWSRGPESHGSMSHRAPGSIGASAFPSRVHKGHHLPGHMGNQRVSEQNLEVVKVDKENNLLVVKGSVPGHNNSFLIIQRSQRKKSKAHKKQEQEKPEAKKETKEKKTQAGKK